MKQSPGFTSQKTRKIPELKTTSKLYYMRDRIGKQSMKIKKQVQKVISSVTKN